MAWVTSGCAIKSGADSLELLHKITRA